MNVQAVIKGNIHAAFKKLCDKNLQVTSLRQSGSNTSVTIYVSEELETRGIDNMLSGLFIIGCWFTEDIGCNPLPEGSLLLYTIVKEDTD